MVHDLLQKRPAMVPVPLSNCSQSKLRTRTVFGYFDEMIPVFDRFTGSKGVSDSLAYNIWYMQEGDQW